MVGGEREREVLKCVCVCVCVNGKYIYGRAN